MLLLLACATPTAPYSATLRPGDTGPADDGPVGDSAPDTAAEDTADSATDSASPDTGDTADSAAPGPTGPPKVIVFIGDGMGREHVAGGGLFANGARGTLAMESLPYAGRLRTASFTGVTDSAAAATTLATGVKTYNDYVGVDRDGVPLENLVERARAAGMATGVVTTDELTGATPASFVAHVASRFDSFAIVEDYVAAMPDLALGGGYMDFSTVEATIDAQILRTADELAAATPDGRPLLGLFAIATMAYSAMPVAGEPTLAEMVAAALAWLDDDPDGFFLVVEGARIDHAAHAKDEANSLPDVAAFDAAVQVAAAWAETAEDVTLLVTADHECGGLEVTDGSAAGEIPESSWRWGLHTNAQVPVYGYGDAAAVLDGEVLDARWAWAVLAAAVDRSRSVTAPAEILLADGATSDLGGAVVTQAWPTSFGDGLNQLDALHVSADEHGLYVGVDGVFERGSNAVLAFLDLDYGSGTGLGAGETATDTEGALDGVIAGSVPAILVPGLGFDAAVGSIGAEEAWLDGLYEYTGLRVFSGDLGSTSDFAWRAAASNFDEGNIAEDGAAPDAGATGATENGLEAFLPWDSLYADGLDPAGAAIAVVVALVNEDGTYTSNQFLPSLGSATEPAAGTASVVSAVAIDVDGTGAVTGGPAEVP